MSPTGARLSALTQDLVNHWMDTQASWRDARMQDFHRKYIEELTISVESARTVIEKVEKLIEKIKRDCE
jgi:hypothetical protein